MYQSPITPSIAIFLSKFSSQVLDNLLAIFRPLVVKHVFLDALPNMPLHQTKLRIDINGNTLACIVYHATDIGIQQVFTLRIAFHHI